MADGLLNKASIILTPTGYKAGTLYNVAPVVEPYEDFDFARASVASRVNSTGLVEMVGRTLGSELVTNGDFSNGSTGWNHVNTSGTSQFIVNNNQLTFTRGAFGDSFNQTDVSDGTPGVYLLTFDILAISGGNLRYSFSPNTARNISNEQTASTAKSYATYFVSDGTLLDFVFDLSANGASVTITNISVKRLIDTNNIPRISYDSNGDNGHILLEPTSTNLITYSEDFTQSFWNNTNGEVISDNLVSAPDGSISAQKWKRIAGTYNMLRPAVNITGTDKTLSVFVKNISADNFYLRGSSSFYFYNFSSQTVSNSNLKAEQYPNGWIRLSTSDTNNNFKQFGIGESETDSTELNNEVYIWGAQLEALSYPTSYIPTLTGSTVTRATETATGAGSADLINSTEGVLYAEIAALVNGGDDRIISLSDETNNNLIYIRIDNTSNRINCFARGGGGTYNILTVNGVNQTNTNKIALVWDASNVRVWINGSQSLTQSINNTPTGMKTLSFTSPTGGSPFYGKVKAVVVFNEALSDAELNNLTG